MIDERERFEEAFQLFDRPEPAWDRLVGRRDRKRRNQRIVAGVVGIAVFVAAVSIVGTAGLSDRTEGPAGGAETGPTVTGPTVTGPTETVGPVPKTDYLLDLNTGAMTPLPESIVGANNNQTGEYATSPDGSRLAYAAPGEDGANKVFVANLDGTRIEQVTPDAVAATSPAWSPDGSKIAYIGHRDDADNLFVLDLATGTSTQLTFATRDDVDPSAPEFGPWAASIPAFTPDGASVVYNAFRQDERGPDEYWPFENEVRIVPIAGGESVRLKAGSDPNDISDTVLSPDGSLLLYDCSYSALCVANIDGTAERVVGEGLGPGSGSWSPDGRRIAYGGWRAQDVSIVDVASGQMTYVAEGWRPTWVDDHTLLIEIPRCYSHRTGTWVAGGSCPG